MTSQEFNLAIFGTPDAPPGAIVAPAPATEPAAPRGAQFWRNLLSPRQVWAFLRAWAGGPVGLRRYAQRLATCASNQCGAFHRDQDGRMYCRGCGCGKWV